MDVTRRRFIYIHTVYQFIAGYFSLDRLGIDISKTLINRVKRGVFKDGKYILSVDKMPVRTIFNDDRHLTAHTVFFFSVHKDNGKDTERTFSYFNINNEAIGRRCGKGETPPQVFKKEQSSRGTYAKGHRSQA